MHEPCVCVYVCVCVHSSHDRFCRHGRLSRVYVYDLLRLFVIVLCYTMLAQVQLSRVYHYIRGEAIIKLYVIFNILEVWFTRGVCSRGLLCCFPRAEDLAGAKP